MSEEAKAALGAILDYSSVQSPFAGYAQIPDHLLDIHYGLRRMLLKRLALRKPPPFESAHW